MEVVDFREAVLGAAAGARSSDLFIAGGTWSPPVQALLCAPSCPWWFSHLHVINHKGHEGTQRKNFQDFVRPGRRGAIA